MMPVFTATLHDVIASVSDIGLSNYPIFNEHYRAPLNRKIIDHYRYWEIGSETVQMFCYNLRVKMGEIMPLYNQLYESERLRVDPFSTMNYVELITGESHSDSTQDQVSDTVSETLTDSHGRAVNSDTPQVLLGGNRDYATSASDSVGNSKVDADSKATAKTESLESQDSTTKREMQGYNAPRSELLLLYRSTFLNVDLLIINELEPLFMGVWDNGESFTENTEWLVWYKCQG